MNRRIRPFAPFKLIHDLWLPPADGYRAVPGPSPSPAWSAANGTRRGDGGRYAADGAFLTRVKRLQVPCESTATTMQSGDAPAQAQPQPAPGGLVARRTPHCAIQPIGQPPKRRAGRSEPPAANPPSP